MIPSFDRGRRGLLKSFVGGAGVALFGIDLAPDAEAATSAPDAVVEVTSWVAIHPDDRVVLRIPQSELGQGVTTALAQLLAEELDLDWPDFDTEYYDPQIHRQRNKVYVHTATLNSWAADLLYVPMRTAGAQVKRMLLEVAAADLGVGRDELTITGRAVHHAASKRSVRFGALAERAAKRPIPAPETVPLKAAKDCRLVGHSVPRLDSHAKSTGAARYGIDVVVEGMKYAAVRQCPVFGGRLLGFDSSEVLKRKGVRQVVAIRGGPSGYNVPESLWDLIDWQMDDAVAVVADSWWQAQQALDALPIRWDTGPHARVDSASIARALDTALAQGGQVMRSDGDTISALDGAAKVVEAEYRFPFMEHAPLEPMNCTALVTPQGVEAWAPTQHADEALRIAAFAAGVAIKDAKFHLMPSGGGFGRRLSNDFVSQAVQVARAVPGVPIKLIASREECMRRGYYAPVAHARFRGGLDAQGRVTAWHSKVAFGRAPVQPYGLSRLPWAIDHVRCEYTSIDSPPPFGWMRGVAHSQGLWMNLGFLGELAEASGTTSYALQLALLDETRVAADRPDREDAIARIRRQRHLLEAVVKHAGGSGHPSQGHGHGRGIAVTDMSYVPGYHSSCVAMAMDVALAADGAVKVERVVAVADVGLAINPRNVEAQVQSGIAFGLSNALNARITLRDGKVEQSNFHDYPLLTLAEMPAVEVHLLADGERPSGIGEEATPVAIAALVDAIRAAGGPRVRALPVRNTTNGGSRDRHAET